MLATATFSSAEQVAAADINRRMVHIAVLFPEIFMMIDVPGIRQIPPLPYIYITFYDFKKLVSRENSMMGFLYDRPCFPFCC
jgi:hypothetical protein